MMTIPLLISIMINTIIGTLPVLGPILSGFLAGVIVGKKNPVMVISFLGAVIGGAFCRIFLLYPNNVWHHDLLNLFGTQYGKVTGMIIQGNPFFFALYFGLLGLLGGFAGAFVLNQMKSLRK